MYIPIAEISKENLNIAQWSRYPGITIVNILDYFF